MNAHQLRGEWKRLKGRIRAQWGRLTDDDLDRMGGNVEELVGAVQSRYGYEKEEATRRVENWLRSVSSDVSPESKRH